MKKQTTQPELPPADENPAPELPAPPRTRKTKRNLPYKFTDAEKVDLGKELGEGVETLSRLENDRKMVADEWKAKISAQEASVASLSNKCSRGYEYRDLPCTITLHDRAPTKKTTRRDDNDEVVDIRFMEESELQEELRFEEENYAAESDKTQPVE